MNLGILACEGFLTPQNITMIDKICQHIWEHPATVRFYNMVTESNINEDVKTWAEMYFGCKFVAESPAPRKLPRMSSVGDSVSTAMVASGVDVLSRSSSGSPRSNTPSPRLMPSPRKLSKTSVNNIQNFVLMCNKVIVVGGHDQIGAILKLFDVPVFLISNV